MPENQRQIPRPAHASTSKRKTIERAVSSPDGAPTGGPPKPDEVDKMGGPTPKKGQPG